MSTGPTTFAKHAVLALLLVAVACTHRGGSPAPSPTASAKPPSVEVIAQNVVVGARAVRIGLHPADPTARVIVTFADLNAASVVAVCGLASADDALPAHLAEPSCRSEIPSGVREEIARSDGLGGLAFWVRQGSAVAVTLRIEFSEGTRALTFEIPRHPSSIGQSPAACRDNACAVVIEARPVHGGRFSASARWTGGDARLALLEGSVLAKSFTATGIPYVVADDDAGPSPASVQARLSAPAEYALVVDGNNGDLTDVRIDARWP